MECSYFSMYLKVMGWSMKPQKGAALVVVLSLLTVSLMVGLSGMQTSQIEERLSGNYRAQADAQMNAERAVSFMLDRVNSSESENGVSLWMDFDASSSAMEQGSIGLFDLADNNSSHCFSTASQAACFVRVTNGLLSLSTADYIFSAGRVVASDEDVVSYSDPLFVEVATIVSGGYEPRAAITCDSDDPSNLLTRCRLFANNPPTVIDGKDYAMNVDTKGRVNEQTYNKYSGDPDRNAAAYIIPGVDAEDRDAINTGSATIEGPTITDAAEWSQENEDGISEQQQFNAGVDDYIERAQGGDEGFIYVGSESDVENFVMPERGILVIDGQDLSLGVRGNFKFTGLVVVVDGSLTLSSSGDQGNGKGAGTIAIVGSVMARNSKIDMNNGNPSVLYSSEALADVGVIGGVGAGGGRVVGVYDIISWR